MFVLTTVLSGCSSTDDYETRDISRDEFGTKWPFVTDAGLLACEPGDNPTITFDGRTIGLSDPDLAGAAWSEDATEASASILRDEALRLCD